jgi:DNA processing protein
MEKATFDRLTLVLLPGFNPRLGAAILARGPLEDTLARPAHAELLPAAARAALASGEARRRAEAERQRAASIGVRVVGSQERDYPPWLGRLYDPPPVLFVRGRLVPDEGERVVAVVGSRAATPRGLTFAHRLARDLAESGVTVVSGLARGIDAAAHAGALEAEGRTVAVLGSGLLRVYPPEHARLADAAAATGALVSEFPLETAPLKVNFPRRNRVIAGWGRAVVVVEAGEKSGALITAQMAVDEGRDVMAVPGHPSLGAAAGTNALLRQGAALVRHADDVLRELRLEDRMPGEPPPPRDDVLAALRRDVPSSVEEVAARSGRAVPELLARLGVLELEARVRRLPGALFVRS